MDTKALIDKVNLSDIVKIPTEIKRETASSGAYGQNYKYDDPYNFQHPSSDFETLTQTDDFEPIQETKSVSTPEVIEDYDAEANARSLVYTLQAIDSIVISGIGIGVNVKRAGGRSNIPKLKEVAQKEYAGEELTANDKKQLYKLKEYQRRMDALEKALEPNPAKTEHLIQVATQYCEATQFTMGSGTAFWITYAGSLVEKITKVAF